MRLSFALIFLMSTILGCSKSVQSKTALNSSQAMIVKNMIEAVNEKDAIKYVEGFAEGAQIFVESELKVDGRAAIIENRKNHFKHHSNVRSEIQYMVEIDNKVILHDKVWLLEEDKSGRDIVEIFTFEDEEVIRIDVIQPKDLFN